MELKLQRKMIKLTFDDQVCEMCIPTSRQLEDYMEQLQSKDVKGKKEVQVLNEFLLKLGMPKDILDQMDILSLKELLEYIGGKKSL